MVFALKVKLTVVVTIVKLVPQINKNLYNPAGMLRIKFPVLQNSFCKIIIFTPEFL